MPTRAGGEELAVLHLLLSCVPKSEGGKRGDGLGFTFDSRVQLLESWRQGRWEGQDHS